MVIVNTITLYLVRGGVKEEVPEGHTGRTQFGGQVVLHGVGICLVIYK